MQTSPELVWIFSSGRSGTTWLMRLMCRTIRAPKWGEPRIGRMLAMFVAREGWRPGGGHILSEADRGAFVAGVRSFVQVMAGERFPNAQRVVVKEPNGAEGAPLISEALPESRLVLVMRDLRDVVASSFDGKQPGSWQNADGAKWAGADRLDMTRQLTKNAVADMQGAIDAYDAHPGPRTLVRYEELLADTPGELARLLTELDLPFNPRRLARVVDELAFDGVSEERRGPGKFFRKATPGSWHTDLTPEQLEIVEELAGPIQQRFYEAPRVP